MPGVDEWAERSENGVNNAERGRKADHSPDLAEFKLSPWMSDGSDRCRIACGWPVVWPLAVGGATTPECPSSACVANSRA